MDTVAASSERVTPHPSSGAASAFGEYLRFRRCGECDRWRVLVDEVTGLRARCLACGADGSAAGPAGDSAPDVRDT